MMYDTYVLFGAPGAGKGTLGKSLARAGGHFHLSSGDVFRSLDPQSRLGKIFSEYADEGRLVPDDVVIEIMEAHLRDCEGKTYFPKEQFLLLDGIPRTLPQAELIDSFIKVEGIIVLDVEDRQVLIDRLMRRASIEGRKDDAQKSVLETRMRVYDQQTLEVSKHYDEALVHRFNADQGPLETLRDVLDQLATPLSRKYRL